MENDKTAALITRLVEISKQGRDTFSDAAAKSEDGLRFLFHAISEQHQQFLDDLTPLSTTSDHDPYPDRRMVPTAGIRRRSAKAEHHELALVNRCADAENEAVLEYQAAIDTPDLSALALEMVQRHLNGMKAARNYLRGLAAF
jgi:uncharacterized protein (TIGR02284 family)